MDTAKTISLLTEFKDAIDRWFAHDYSQEQETALRTAINKNARAAQAAVRRVGCLRLITLAPPPAVGGPIVPYSDPFDMIFEDYFGLSVIPSLSDMVEQAIGVYETRPPELGGQAADPNLSVFISHTSSDAGLAQKLIDLLRCALHLRADAIRCTSVDGYRLPAGADTDEQLRREVLDSPLFIGLISEESIRSAYVLFELGARWGAGRQLTPLLAPQTSPDVLRGPISGLNALQCDSRGQLLQLIRDSGGVLGISPESPDAIEPQIDAILRLATTSETGYRSQATAEEFADAERIIAEHCESEWPDDYRMRVRCEDQQRKAMADLRSTAPDDLPFEVFRAIREKAASEWPRDYRMRLHAEREQIQAYREIKRRQG